MLAVGGACAVLGFAAAVFFVVAWGQEGYSEGTPAGKYGCGLSSSSRSNGSCSSGAGGRARRIAEVAFDVPAVDRGDPQHDVCPPPA